MQNKLRDLHCKQYNTSLCSVILGLANGQHHHEFKKYDQPYARSLCASTNVLRQMCKPFQLRTVASRQLSALQRIRHEQLQKIAQDYIVTVDHTETKDFWRTRIIYTIPREHNEQRNCSVITNFALLRVFRVIDFQNYSIPAALIHTNARINNYLAARRISDTSPPNNVMSRYWDHYTMRASTFASRDHLQDTSLLFECFSVTVPIDCDYIYIYKVFESVSNKHVAKEWRSPTHPSYIIQLFYPPCLLLDRSERAHTLHQPCTRYIINEVTF